jgi:EAL domain-containing protein (putative c-di-GMP-specific phosphodiesterase class I)
MFKSYKDEKIIRILIALGKALNLKIVVEGVEEVKEIDFLTKLGAYIFQGYYFGKPESLKTVVEKLEKGTYLEKLKELDLQLDEFESKRSSEES